LARVVPVYAAFFMIIMLSSVGLPGLNGFVGEFLILLGAFKSQLLASHWYAIVGATGVIFAAVYLLWSYQRVFFGKLENPANQSMKDLNLREWVVLVPVVLLVAWIGLYPATFMEKTEASTKQLVQMLHDARRGVHPGAAQHVVFSPADVR
jgi:NADH-quinone oxidoreductase subunit M